MSRSKRCLVVVAGLVAAASLSCGGRESCTGQACGSGPSKAHGTFRAKAGSDVSGTVHLEQVGSVVTLTVDVQGAKPGPHGLHIHAKGDCTAPDFSSAGGHFNPTNAPHACPPTEPRHAGDFGNIEIGADGTGHLRAQSDHISLAPSPNAVTGLAVILHDGKDDCSSQPAGDSGMRLACAVIEPE